MPRIDKVELLAGAFVFAVGAYFFFASQEYRMGTMARMGPGYIPYVLGAISMGLGGLIVLTGLGRESEMPKFSLRASGAVLGAILTFALLLERVGLVPAVTLSAAVAMMGNREARPLLVVVTSLTLAALCWFLFIALLGLQMRSFRMPF